MMRKISVLGVVLMLSFLACLPAPGLAEPDSPGNKSLDEAKELLKNITSQSEEMLNQSEKEYMETKNESGMDSSAIDDFEAMMSGIGQLIDFLNGLVDSAVTILDQITTIKEKFKNF